MATIGRRPVGTRTFTTSAQQRQQPIRGSRLVTGPAEISGTSTTTDADDTSSISAGHGPNGTSATTDASDVSTVSAGHGPNATSASTDAADTSSISAGHGPNGTSATTDAADTSTVSAGHGPNGTIAATEANDVSSITGSHATNVTGTIAAVDADDTANVVGSSAGASTPIDAGGGGTRPRRPHQKPSAVTPPTPRPTIIGVVTCVEQDDVCEAYGTANDPLPDFDADLELLILVGAI